MKVGLSCSAVTLNEERCEALAKSGISHIELGLGYEWCNLVDLNRVAKNAEKSGLTLWSSHLPFVPNSKVHMASLDKEIRKHTLEIYAELSKKLGAVGVDKIIIHPSGEPIGDDVRAEFMKCACESFAALAEIAAREGVTVAVEDLPRTCLGHTSAEISEILASDDRLRVCFDTNHLTEESNLDFLQNVGNKIITVHISDFDFINERHWLPGEGKLEWVPIYNKLLEIGYGGPWLYEIGLTQPKTIYRDRNLTYDDFYNNAQTIFSGKEPEMPEFSHHKEVLGMWE